MKKILKSNTNNLVSQVQGDKVIIRSNEKNTLIVLNETAKVLLQICNGKTAEEAIKELYEMCLDKETIIYDEVEKDCLNALKELEEAKLISILEE